MHRTKRRRRVVFINDRKYEKTLRQIENGNETGAAVLLINRKKTDQEESNRYPIILKVDGFI